MAVKTKINNIIEEIRAYARPRYIPVMLNDGADVLINTVKQHKPKTILEIGTSLGTSGILMLDNSDATLTTIDINEEAVELAKGYYSRAGVRSRATFIIGDCTEIIPLMSGTYDMIMLDGPKGQYIMLLPYLIDLLSVGGVMFADNIGFHNLVNSNGEVLHKHRTIVTNLRSFVTQITDSPLLDTTILTDGDGIGIIIKRSSNEKN